MDFNGAIAELEKQGLLVKDGPTVDVMATMNKSKQKAGDNHLLSFDILFKEELGGPIPEGLVDLVGQQLGDLLQISIMKLREENPGFAKDLDLAIDSGRKLIRGGIRLSEEKQAAGGMIDFSKGDGRAFFSVDLGISNEVALDGDMLNYLADSVKNSMTKSTKMFGFEDTRIHVSATDKNLIPALDVLMKSAQSMTNSEFRPSMKPN